MGDSISAAAAAASSSSAAAVSTVASAVGHRGPAGRPGTGDANEGSALYSGRSTNVRPREMRTGRAIVGGDDSLRAEDHLSI